MFNLLFAIAIVSAVAVMSFAILHDWHNPDTCRRCAARNLDRIR